ncbi:T9SS type A sorting domain-containing protein, partial [Bacteroidales bacterium OttesenSCG-928-L03]|nr:T9SS type A sorting domain-containing protein [Bacteroidales bacterium OttesenSCG-928-L03]
ERVYRFAVAGEQVHIYRDKDYIGTKELDYLKEIQADDTEAESAGTYGTDIIGEWAGANQAGTGMPTAYGWACTASAPWNTAGSGSGVRYLDNQNHTYGNGKYNGRLMTIRWDSDELLTAYYSYPVTLEGYTAYEFSLLYELWANAAAGVSMTVGISTTRNASGLIDSKTFVTGAQNTLQKGNFSFTSREAGQYYLIFSGGARAMYGIGDLSLKPVSFNSRLLIGKNYNGGNADFDVFYVSYQEGTYAAAKEDTVIEAPDLEGKAKLPTQLQGSVNINAAGGSKDIHNLEFAPSGDYSVEVSARVSVAEDRGLDIEARDGYGKGFRTSMNQETFRFTAPFSSDLASLSKTDNRETQVVRYAVEGEKVHIYQNKQYLKSYDLVAIGNMNNTGTLEEEIAIEKPDNITDESNLIDNPNFAADAHNAAPTGWLSNITLGSGVNPRIQEKSQTTELSAYPDGQKAFMIRYDGDATYFSYPLTLETNAWFEYSFDVITWGENRNAEFEVAVSTTVDASSGVIASKTVKTPAVRAAAERRSIRFKTTTNAAVPQAPYYLVFKKINTVGTIGITDLYLHKNSLSRLLFGKNYTEGYAAIEIDYITVDYSGAYAPKEEEPPVEIPQADSGETTIFSTNNELHVLGIPSGANILVFDLMGRLVLNQKTNSETYSAFLPQGIYIVKVAAKRQKVLIY